MKNSGSALFLFSLLTLSILACTNAPSKRETANTIDTPSSTFVAQTDPLPPAHTITDPRDEETYATIKIGKQIWLAENLRYNAPGSMINPDNPSKAYGRLYKLISAQTACPKGWHLPSDSEWDEVEMAHGMPASFVGKGGWRGEHGTHMKSVAGWEEDGSGTNRLGFNVLPAGYYFSGKMGFEEGLEGLGYSAAYWSSMKDSVATARFLFSPREWVNKWEDKGNESGAALGCRCVKD